MRVIKRIRSYFSAIKELERKRRQIAAIDANIKLLVSQGKIEHFPYLECLLRNAMDIPGPSIEQILAARYAL